MTREMGELGVMDKDKEFLSSWVFKLCYDDIQILMTELFILNEYVVYLKLCFNTALKSCLN